MSAAAAATPEHASSSTSTPTVARPVVRKTLPHVWFPAGLLIAWRELTKTEIVIDGIAREMCDGLERRISAAKFAERAGVDPSDARKALRKLVELGLQKRGGNVRDPGGYVVTPASSEEVSKRISDAMPIDFAVPAAIVREWQQWSRLEIRVFGAVCVHKEARRRGLRIAPRVTSTWLAGFLKEPDRSCRLALRELARRRVIRREDGHRWAPTPWNELACAGDQAKLLAPGRAAVTVLPSRSSGKQAPELAAMVPPSSWQRGPQACGRGGPDRRGATVAWPPSSPVVRPLSTRGRDLPPRDPPPSVHPEVGREGDGYRDEEYDTTAALAPLARVAAKAFGDRNAAVDVNHAVRRLADVKMRYRMSYKELEQYVRAAPDQPGLLRAGFPFGAAFSPGRVKPWLEKQRRRRHPILQRSQASECQILSAAELASRGTAFLASFVSRSPPTTASSASSLTV